MMNQKTKHKVDAMREGGKKLGGILQELLDYSVPGKTLKDVEALAMKRIHESGGVPSFTTVEGYKWATCLCVDDVIVHGIPTDQKLIEGNLFTIDIGMIYKGYHTDTGWSKVIQKKHSGYAVPQKTKRFLETGKEALKTAIDEARVGNRVGHISQAIQRVVEGKGYGVVTSLIGHGVGEELHMPPQIPGVLRGSVRSTLPLVSGMTLAIEVIYTMGNPAICYVNNDGWSIATRDRSLSAVFEQTVIVTDDGPCAATPSHTD